MRARPLTPMLGPAFTVAQARTAGESAERLRRADLAAPHRGVRTRGTLPHWAAYAPALRPGERFSHSTAAEIWGAPLPWSLRGEVHTTVGPRQSRAKGANVVGHQSPRVGMTVRDQVPVSRPVDVLLELAPSLDVHDLVAVGDYLVLRPRFVDPRDPRPHTSIADLQAGTRAFRGRGARSARIAAALVREGVESPMETRLRLLLTGSGIPEPHCGFELPGRRGTSIGWFDLAWPEFQVIAEYDGDQHRTSTHQYERDIRRFDAAEEIGWRVVRVRKHGVLQDPVGTVTRMTTALRSHGWNPA